jgi:hypothetical protein
MLDRKLNQRIKKRVESVDFRVCASHDPAPVFGGALGIKVKDLERSGKFLGLLR